MDIMKFRSSGTEVGGFGYQDLHANLQTKYLVLLSLRDNKNLTQQTRWLL